MHLHLHIHTSLSSHSAPLLTHTRIHRRAKTGAKRKTKMAEEQGLDLQLSQLSGGLAELQDELSRAIDIQDYAAATRLNKLILQLKAAAVRDPAVAAKASYTAEVQRAGDTYEAETEHYNAVWTRSLREYEERARARTDELEALLGAELAEVEESFAPRPIKYSRELLNLREKQNFAARNGQLKLASAMKDEADRMEAAEVALYRKEQGDQLARFRDAVTKKYDVKRSALCARIDSGKVEIMLKWAQDLEHLALHYDAAKRTEEVRAVARMYPKERCSPNVTVGLNALGSRRVRAADSPVSKYIREDATVETAVRQMLRASPEKESLYGSLNGSYLAMGRISMHPVQGTKLLGPNGRSGYASPAAAQALPASPASPVRTSAAVASASSEQQ